MRSKSFEYIAHLQNILEKIKDTQWETIDTCAKLIAKAISEKHTLFAYGASHASILTQELFYRAGGLAIFNPIMPSDVMLSTRPITLTTTMEYSTQLTSRHESDKKLYELCDYVLDNCGDFGDTSTSIDGLNQKVAPTSTISGCTIVNMLLIRTVEYLLEMGIEPPIFHSANMDGGDEFNDRIFKEYKDQNIICNIQNAPVCNPTY